MRWEIDDIRAAVVACAREISGRESDGAFLEATLRNALAQKLAGEVEVERRLGLSHWSPRLGGVDIVVDPRRDGERVGIETKVWAVEDALFDLFKLAAGSQQGKLRTGYLVIAARPRDWARQSVVSAMSVNAHPASLWTVWSTTGLLTAEATDWARIWHHSPAQPQRLPAQIATIAAAPVDMPQAPGQEVRIIGARAVGDDTVALDQNGLLADRFEPRAALGDRHDPEGLFASVQAGIEDARSRPPGAIFYSPMDPTDKIRSLNALLAEYPELEAEISGYMSTAVAQRDARGPA